MYDIEKLLNVLTNPSYRIIDENGKIFPPSNEIYSLIETAMDGNPKRKHVYTIVKNNRNGIHDKLLRSFSIILKTDDTVIDDSFNPNISADKVVDKFNVTISAAEWSLIKPEETVYGDGKNYITFKLGWTDLLAEKIWKKLRLPCIWSFKRVKGSLQEKGKNTSIRIRGKCNECGAKVICIVDNCSVKNKDILAKITIKNFQSGFIHKGRRQLRGKRRQDVANHLINTKTDAITYIRNEAKNLIQFGDPYPPILPKSDVLRKAKNEVQEKRLGITGSLPISNLVDAQHTTQAGIIKKIGASPFFCHYWTKDQKLFYKLNLKRNDSFMTIDATGSIVKKIKYSHTKSKYIFLYQCMIASSIGSAPVFQMLSADHTASAITTWLLTILSDNVAIPKVIVCDFCMALLISVAIAFGKKADLQDYLNTCFQIIMNKTQTCLATYIRIDVSHLVAIVCRWKCIKKHAFTKVRQFFIKSICNAYQMNNIEDLKYFLESVLVVALSHSFTSDSGEALPSQTRFQYVNSIIKGMPASKIDEDNNEEIEESEENEMKDIDEKDLNDQCSEAWIMWSTKIYEQAASISLQCCDGETLNAYYNTEVAKNIKRLMYYLPLWTGIMIPFFGVKNRIATSSSVESEFANIKQRAFKNVLPQRVDKFVFSHIDYLDGRIKEASAKFTLKSKESNEENCFSKNIVKESANQNAHTDIKSEFNMSKESIKENCFSKDILGESANQNGYIDIKNKNNFSGDSSITKELNITKDSSGNKLISDNMSQVDYLSNVSLQYNSTSDNVQNPSMENTDVHEKSIKIDEIVDDKSLENANECDVQPNNPLNANENWGGKITPDKKKKRPNYMDPFPDWDYVQSDKFVDIPLLRNGNLCDSIKLKDKYVSVRNTCAFDSFLQLLAHAIAKGKVYKSCVQDFELPILKLAQNMLTRGKIMINDYKNCAEILQESKLCELSHTRHIQFLKAECNVDQLIHFVFKDLPSVTRITKCSNCYYKHYRHLPTLCINVDILFRKGFNHVQEAIDDTENLRINQTLCKQCGSNLERIHDYGPHVFLDTSVISDSRYNIECKQNVTLGNITKMIKLGEKSYTLCGIIDYKGNRNKSPTKLGHYTAMVYTGFGFYEYNDFQIKKSYVQPHTIVTPHSIMYVTNE